ncbi:MAG: hypothetical protein KC620_19815, partial [Myxococcales bacterium]|nr:hypothetical protein [Myxococcales bacterium]
DGRTALAGLSGWGLRAGETLVEWRRTAGDLRDAAWDGTTLFAVGAEGLWRWQPGRPAAVPVPLPAALAGRPLIRVFRDGPYLWVQDEAGTGWPLGGVRSGEASLVGAPGPLPRADAGLRVRLGDWRVNAVRGEPRVRVGADDDLAAPIETNGPVHALLPLGADAVLVAAGTQVMLLRLDDPPRREAIWPLGVEVIALFLEGERLIGVTRHAGFLEARVQWPGPPPAPISAAD